MFTAIAMIAFVGSSMANTIELEKLSIENETVVQNTNEIKAVNEFEVAEKTTKSDCVKIRKFVAMVLLNSGENAQTANYFANFVYDACMEILVE